MSGLGEEIMVLEGLEPGVANWPGPAWSYCDACKDAERYGRAMLADFPNLGIDESAICNDGIEGLSDLPMEVAYKASTKLRFRTPPKSKRRKHQIEGEKARVGMVANAAADPNNPKSKEVAKLLSIKASSLAKLAQDRRHIVSRAKGGYKCSLALVKKLDTVVARAAIAADRAPPSQKASAIAKVQKINTRRMQAARDATRYAKLASLANMQAANADTQATLSAEAASAVRSGDRPRAAGAAESIRVIGLRSHQLKQVRENQKRLWRLRNTKANYRRNQQRLLLVGNEINRLQVKNRDQGLSPVETNELNKLSQASISIKSEMSKIEKGTNEKVKQGPVYQREVDKREAFGPSIDPDTARMYASGDVMSKLDDETFMPPDGSDIYPAIEHSRDRPSKLAFLNETYLAGLTEHMPRSIPGRLAGYVHATSRGLAAASDEMLRRSFQTVR